LEFEFILEAMLQRTRETLTVILIALLPLHALFVTVATRLFAGLGHAPLPALALWKEVLLAVILLIAFAEWIIHPAWKKRWSMDRLDILLIVLLILSVVVTGLTHGQWRLYLLGFKYDFLPLVAFFALRRVLWSDVFLKRALHSVMLVGGVIAAYGIVTFFLPQQYFHWLGYSDLHSLYLPNAPIAGYQQIGGSFLRRIQSTMSGPNQLGLWLLLPWTIGVVTLFTSPIDKRWLPNLLHFHVDRRYIKRSAYLLLIGIALLLTFSRSAWIAALVILVTALYDFQTRDAFLRAMVRLVAVVGGTVILIMVLAPGTLLRVASSRDHFLRPLQATHSIMQYPFGRGLGMAGPASNRVSDPCVYLEAGADASWAAVHPNLCVFVDGRQVQPVERTCLCPLLPENWYLQLGIELGTAGFALFLAFILLTIHSLRARYGSGEVFLIFLGISVAALFLHAWEDSAVAFTVWILVAACSPRERPT
jgi:hypothetical protein